MTNEKGELLSSTRMEVSNRVSVDRFEGYYSNDKMNGNGNFVTIAEQYVGEFVNGMREGDGELRFKNGTLYQGSFKKGFPEGTDRYNSQAMEG